MKLDPQLPLTSSQLFARTLLRIILFAASLVFLGLPIGGSIAVARQPPSEFVIIALMGFVAVGSLGIGCLGIWVSVVTLRPWSAEKLERVNSEAPEFSENALVCRSVDSRSVPVAVVIDPDSKLIHFRNCHWPKGFWVIGAQSWYQCPLTTVVRAYRQTLRGKGRAFRSFVIETEGGKAQIPEGFLRYENLCGFLEERTA